MCVRTCVRVRVRAGRLIKGGCVWPAVTFPQPGLAEGHGVLTLGGLRPMHHADGTPLTAHELHNQTNVLVHHPDGTQQTVNELLAQMRRLDRPASDPGSDSGVEVISVADDELDADVEVCVAVDGHSQACNAFGKRHSNDNTGDGPTDGSSPQRFRPTRDAARNNAAGPSGAGPSGGMEVGPPAACAPKPESRSRRRPSARLLRASLRLPQTRPCRAPRHQRPRTWFPHTREWSGSERAFSSSYPRHALRLISARFAFTRGHPPANSPLRPRIPNEDPPPPFAGQAHRSQSRRGERRRGPVGRGPVGQR